MTRIPVADVSAALEAVFAADSELYRSRGLQRRIGYGRKPALLNIDLANAWTRPGHAFSCEGMEIIIPAVQRLLSTFRDKSLPIVYTTMAYRSMRSSVMWRHWPMFSPIWTLCTCNHSFKPSSDQSETAACRPRLYRASPAMRLWPLSGMPWYGT